MMTNPSNLQQIEKHETQTHSRSPQLHADQGRHYQAYLLRCWAETLAETVIWRFSLEAIPNGKRIGFAELADVLSFLDRQTGMVQIDD